MDSQPIRDERILEALEVCRAHGDDLTDPVLADLADQLSANPELKRLYDELQGVDARLSAAFRDVPVPEGLAERIVDRLEAAQTDQAPTDHAEQTDEHPAKLPAVIAPPRPRRASRRRLLAIAGVFSTGAALLVAALIYVATRNPYDLSRVLVDANKFYSDESPEPGHLLADVDDPLLDDYPFSREVRRFPGTRWRRISGFLGRSGVAYDLPGPGGAPKATLYVVKLRVTDLREREPPARPQRNTANCCTATWGKGKLLYVLVVRGSRRAYDDCLRLHGLVT